jgi:DNA-binding response OmpR family regulator
MPQTAKGRKTIEPSKTQQAREAYEYKPADQRDLPLLLLVEDNQDMRAYIRSQLSGEYRVEEALNGQDGTQMASQLVPDLIITDLMMPKMDGMEFCQIIKTRPETSHIPVIMLTARAGIENKLAGLETGADDYLTKPFETRELMTRIRNLIVQRIRIREHYQAASPLIPEQLRVNSLDRDFLERLQQLLENQYGDAEFGPKQMQEQLNMSKTQLHRKAKSLTGESPGELLRNFRLKRASQLLSQNADTVTQIAYSVGFNNLSYFARTFKERFGVSPSAFSKNS